MMRTHPSPYALGQLAEGAAPPAARAEVESHLAGCATCQAALAETRQLRERFSQDVFPRTVSKLQAPAAARRVAWWTPLVLFSVAALVLLVIRRDTEPAFTFKGGPSLRVVARRGGQVVEVPPGGSVHPGDQLRLQVDPRGYPYVLVAAVDQRGQVSVYVPFDGARSAEISSPTFYPETGSLIADDVPGPERVFAFLSRSPLEADHFRPALAELGRRGPAALRATSQVAVTADAQVSFLWEKDHL